jgi:hypothetical protein
MIGAASMSEAAISQLINELVERVGGDPYFMRWFRTRKLRQLVVDLNTFVTAALHGVPDLRVADFTAALVAVGVGEDALDRIVEHLGELMDDLEIDPALSARTVALFAPVRQGVLGN